ncbi:MAG: hypothetical protein ACOCZ7_00255, partial [Armatimonadota bacterium]
EIEEAGGRDDDWEPLTVYLTDEQHREFNKPFFMRLQLEHAELQDYMKRELQQAAIEVAMEHKEEVAERAHEVHARTGELDEGRDPHLRMHMLSEVDEIAIAIGEPPHHRYHDDYLPYVLRSRLGEDLESQFVTVLEPYEPDPFIASTRALPLDAHEGDGFACAVEVALTDGRRDIIILAEKPGRVEAGGVTLDGQMGFVRMQDGEVIDARLFRGTRLATGNWELTSPVAEITGTVAEVNTEDWRDNRITLDASVLRAGLTVEDLVGRHIIVENEARSDACYKIRGISEEATVISTGEETLIERLADVNDLSAGYITTIKPGERFTIPLSAEI